MLDQKVHLRQLCSEQRRDLRELSGWYRAILHHRDIAADYRERATQLVGGEIQELRLGMFQLFHPVRV
jgi:hypothetical protein